MTGLLEGRTAIVTGAGRGIGRALTESVASPGVARQLVAIALRSFGSIDIVVNNAAIRRDAPAFRLGPLDWDAVIRNNLSAAFYLINAASAVMRDKGRGGRIVNIVSTAGLYGALGQAAYARAKAGLFGLTRVSAMELAPEQITVNAVAPFAATRVTDAIEPATDTQRAVKERTLRIGAHHAANLVTALCTAEPKDITGQLLGVRGREVFLFSQPRPIATLEVETPETLSANLLAKFGAHLTDMTTDADAFDTDPLT